MPVVQTGDVALAYESHGSGWPLVFLHGGFLDRELWRPQREQFAGEFQVVSVDLRDHGESSAASDGYGVARMAADVTDLFDEIGLQRPVVAGLSLGGLVAQRIAADRPDRVAGLVLADTVRSVGTATLPSTVRRLLFPATSPAVAVRSMGAGAYYRMLLNGIKMAQGGRWLARTEAAREYALDAVDQFDPARFLRVLRALTRFDSPSLPDVPTLLVHGEQEAGPVVRQNRRLARKLDAPRAVVPDAGHLSNRDNPDVFNTVLAGFLDDRVSVPA